MQEAWPQSRNAMLGTTGMNPQSKISDTEIQAIADSMDTNVPESNAFIPPSAGGPQFDVSPEQASQLMIQNYIKNNGSIIIDAATREVQSGIILG